ncbi:MULTISPECIES: GNAT family N-acetyltransferase [unclassified Capnocytophaga]|jgi:Acetyltransferase (GNAT) family.|uniref:GNAT family N-acetyltransferase n=1 Tax=unclassified Capnocytophaga TaxID=2640652 RepID=UPI000202B328|nr:MULTISPECIES: GNAT family N-acetyltransferase [unclassified Capnocytophaga]EGD34087.1 GNAT family acetyltransferase [Capnocytophaga sp. oral taxon 338 str. F0234]MEB3004378.1 GNAT family N-acetyltransferase [Capnocytophaga sp. G2]
MFRQAKITDLEPIWQIILYAKKIMKQRGSQQWQDGYPFRETITEDITQGHAYVVEEENEIIAYVAISLEGEPTYQNIVGAWLNTAPYTVIHRMAVSEKGKNKGLGSYIMQQAEKISTNAKIHSIRVDTNYDNYVMKHILEKQGYTYCGIIQVRDGKREAFQKILR